MNNRKQTPLWLAVLVGLAAGVALLWVMRHSDSNISATIVSITNRPNLAEDGYYSLTVQDGTGHSYVVDATGYLNTPVTPESRGQACINMPKVAVGDRVEFNLPKSEAQADAFVICYPKDATGYYFRHD